MQFRAFYVNKPLKLVAMAFDKIFPVVMGTFPIKTTRITQWVHLFSMDFEDFSTMKIVILLTVIYVASVSGFQPLRAWTDRLNITEKCAPSSHVCAACTDNCKH